MYLYLANGILFRGKNKVSISYDHRLLKTLRKSLRQSGLQISQPVKQSVSWDLISSEFPSNVNNP